MPSAPKKKSKSHGPRELDSRRIHMDLKTKARADDNILSHDLTQFDTTRGQQTFSDYIWIRGPARIRTPCSTLQLADGNWTKVTRSGGGGQVMVHAYRSPLDGARCATVTGGDDHEGKNAFFTYSKLGKGDCLLMNC
jgi:hypothetical protein